MGNQEELKERLSQYFSDEYDIVADTLDEILAKLSNLGVTKFLECMYTLHKKPGMQLSVIQDYARLMLPYLYTSNASDLVDNIRTTKGDPEADTVSIPFVTDVSAELLMSNVDRRSAEFRIVPVSSEEGSEYQVRPGRYHISMPPNSGISDITRSIADVTHDLNNRHMVSDCVKSLKMNVEASLFETRVRKQADKDYTHEQKKSLLRQHLNPNPILKKPGYYWLSPIRLGDEKDKSVLREWLCLFAQVFKREYPMVYMMCLAGDDDQEPQESAELEILHELMLLKDNKD